MLDMQDGDLEADSVRLEEAFAAVSSSGRRGVPAVQTVGRAVEIRGAAAQLVGEILQEWLDSQNRRIAFLGRETDRDKRKQIAGILARTAMVHRVLSAWEGVLAVPQENKDTDFPGN